MPLTKLKKGQTAVVTSCSADEKELRKLESLGLTCGTLVSVLFDRSGDLVLNVRNSRLAIGKSVASKFSVQAA